MNSIERFYATINREEVDRPAAWLGMPDIHAQPALFDYYKVKNMHELKLAIGDDFYAVDVPYHSENASAIYAAFDWYMNGSDVDAEDRTLTTPGCFCNAEEAEDLDFFPWPDPEKYIDREECRRIVDMAPADKVKLGMYWSAHFQDTCASFGMETALMNMLSNPEIYTAVDEKVINFYLRANEIFYEATKGKLHAVLIGNDMGSQRGLMLSPQCVRDFVIPGCRKLVEQAHAYDLKVIYHSCGSIVDVIPDLIAAGVDVIHPIQALAAGMEPQNLKDRFGDKVSFCGGVDTQDLLVNGTPEQVRAKVEELRTIFPTGLIISPSHEAILPDVPPANIHALLRLSTGSANKIVLCVKCKSRHPKGAALTRCGASLLEESRSILTACRNLGRRISHLEEYTPLHIVSSITIASFLLPEILGDLKASSPEIQISVRVASANAAIDILRRGDADIAFWEGMAPKGSFQTIRLDSYQLCAACAPDFPLSGQTVTPKQLCGYPLLLREKGSAIRDTLDNTLALANLTAEPAWESVNSLALVKAAEARLSIAVLPEKLLWDSFLLKKLRFIPLDNMKMENQMLALFHRDKYITKPFQLLIDRLVARNESCSL